jgi:hypothetical protein
MRHAVFSSISTSVLFTRKTFILKVIGFLSFGQRLTSMQDRYALGIAAVRGQLRFQSCTLAAHLVDVLHHQEDNIRGACCESPAGR